MSGPDNIMSEENHAIIMIEYRDVPRLQHLLVQDLDTPDVPNPADDLSLVQIKLHVFVNNTSM